MADYELGQEIKADIFEEGDKIDATATSKVKDTKVLSKDITLVEDQNHTVLNIIDTMVQVELLQHQ